MNDNYSIKEINQHFLQKSNALDLVWKVFLEFEAPEYSDEGIQEFKNFIALNSIKNKITNKEFYLWGCFDGDKIIGVLATRQPCHISLLFVDKEHHRQGIAKALYKTALKHYQNNSNYVDITVNSSPYALEAYRKLGFVGTDTEQTVNGIRFIPMKHIFR